MKKGLSPEVLILEELLAAEPDLVSGRMLAEKLGVSRVAVWQHMEKLRARGFSFEAVRARGYRLLTKPAGLDADLVRAYRHGQEESPLFDLFDEIDSTNDEAARQLAAGRVAPFAIFASRQTKGRGRFGRVWHSEANGNLYASFAFRPEIPPTQMQTFTLWMGLNICELIASFCRSAPGIKWPNDILFGRRKVGGMLTEARMDSDHIRDLVFGLGINVNSPAQAWPETLAGQAISLAEHTRQPIDVNRFTAALLGRVPLAYRRFLDGSYAHTFLSLWQRHDILRGEPVVLIQGDRRISGVAAGIDEEGALLVRTTHGIEACRAGEVTVAKKP